MKISGIDKDFVNIINYLDENGFKPYASCDGVEENHLESQPAALAYISFLKVMALLILWLLLKEIRKNFRI